MLFDYAWEKKVIESAPFQFSGTYLARSDDKKQEMSFLLEQRNNQGPGLEEGQPVRMVKVYCAINNR